MKAVGREGARARCDADSRRADAFALRPGLQPRASVWESSGVAVCSFLERSRRRIRRLQMRRRLGPEWGVTDADAGIAAPR